VTQKLGETRSDPMKSLMTRLSVLALILVVALSVFGVASTAEAGDHYGRGYWKICYESQVVPYTVCEYTYDHCGYAYPIHRTYYKTITVPVRKWIPYY
jgi:hypothetical protein